MKQIFLWLTLFSIAMGYLETSVVVYLRTIYYPDGFSFPLVNMNTSLAITELGREAATIVMLTAVGIIAGKNNTQRFAWFLYCFAIWDIFYYVFLKILLDWPQSLFTWDILFLIPLPWVAPVIAPCIVSLTMLGLAFTLIYFNEKKSYLTLSSAEWLLLVSGSIIVIISFTIDFCKFVHSYNGEITDAISHYIPHNFNWWIFCPGESIILLAIFLFYIRAKKIILCSNSL
jgi:hypothetical protein